MVVVVVERVGVLEETHFEEWREGWGGGGMGVVWEGFCYPERGNPPPYFIPLPPSPPFPHSAHTINQESPLGQSQPFCLTGFDLEVCLSIKKCMPLKAQIEKFGTQESSSKRRSNIDASLLWWEKGKNMEPWEFISCSGYNDKKGELPTQCPFQYYSLHVRPLFPIAVCLLLIWDSHMTLMIVKGNRVDLREMRGYQV